MNRRSFFRKLGVAAGVGVVAPMVIPKLLETVPDSGRKVWVLDWQDVFASARNQVRSDTTDMATADQIRKAVARYTWYEQKSRVRRERREALGLPCDFSPHQIEQKDLQRRDEILAVNRIPKHHVAQNADEDRWYDPDGTIPRR